MVILIENRANSVWLKVNSAIDISGFSATLAACGVLQEKTDLTAHELIFTFTAAQVAKMSRRGTYGTLVVYDGEGRQYIKYLPLFKLVSEDEAESAIGNQTIYITIASKKESSGATDGDLRKTDFVQIEDPKASTKSLQSWAIQLSNTLRGFAQETK